MDVDEFFVTELDLGCQNPLNDRIEQERRNNRERW